LESIPAEDLERAARLYDEGAVEEATAIYNRAIQRGNEAQRKQGLWALAKIHYQQGDNTAAESTIDSYLASNVTPAEERLALLLKGTLHYARGNDKEAEQALNSYVGTGGAATAYAELRLADLSARQGQVDQAVQTTTKVLMEPLPASVTSNARLSLARFYKDSGDSASALQTYELLGSEAATRNDRAEALWLAANLAWETGDAARALTSLQTLLAVYPGHERAAEALDDPRFAPNIAIGSRALVLFSQRSNADAESAYRAIIDAGDPALAADAHYHLGILAERASNYEEALAEYDATMATVAASQQTATASQALWDKGTVLELLGRIDEAVGTYSAIADTAPASEHASEAVFRAGILRYKQGRGADARAIWSRQRSLVAGEADQARAYFWSAKAARMLGDKASASEDLNTAAGLSGVDYYALRARAELASSDLPTGGELPSAAPDWTLIEEWLRASAGREDPSARTEFLTSPAFQRAVELLSAGLRADAETEFEQLIEDAAGNSWLLYRLSRAAGDEGLRSIAARAAARFITASNGTPPQVLALAYPAIYPEIVNEQASRNKLSPFLLLALVRQESFYDARAVSPANASGLTQVIPDTAAQIAESLGEKDFRISDLLRPKVSLRFGAHYLGSQLDLLGGDIPAALAAYNGGPGNATRWQQAAASSDPDVFLESIDFSETRAYVELVLENYAVYLYAYGLTSQPLLPLG
jgi:soluble lytic murein transglycosylase